MSASKLISTILLAGCSLSFAQSYDFRQGYIFEQKFIKRIPLKQAEQVAESPGVFNQYLSWKWENEKINNSRIKRVGDRLIVEFDGKSPLSLRNYTLKSDRQTEGEHQLFRYLKSIPGYHIVGVTFGHDQPAFLLVSDSGKEIYFVETN